MSMRERTSKIANKDKPNNNNNNKSVGLKGLIDDYLIMAASLRVRVTTLNRRGGLGLGYSFTFGQWRHEVV